MSASSLTDAGLEAIKWPLALCSIIILPFSINELQDSGIVSEIFSKRHTIVGGFLAYFFLWVFLFRKPSAGYFFSTFEHELTHAFFALLTFKSVTGLQVTWKSGGACQIAGGTNWLIYIAPYFFPTLMIIPIALSFVVERQYFASLEVMLGAIMAYQITSTYIETHRGQTDLRETSFLFAALFLPTANVMIYATALIYFLRGGDEASDYISNSWLNALNWSVGFF